MRTIFLRKSLNLFNVILCDEKCLIPMKIDRQRAIKISIVKFFYFLLHSYIMRMSFIITFVCCLLPLDLIVWKKKKKKLTHKNNKGFHLRMLSSIQIKNYNEKNFILLYNLQMQKPSILLWLWTLCRLKQNTILREKKLLF